MSSVGNLLSEFRKTRRLSQLDLSMLADVSSRHISFLENGRSSPSREMLLRLADVLDLPLRDSNLLLSAAGFAMTYSNKKLDDEQMQPVKEALEVILINHNPYPALVMDSCWNVIMINSAQEKLLNLLPIRQDPAPEQPNNLLKMVFDPNGFRNLLSNWEELAGFLLRRLRKQVLAFNRPDAEILFQELLSMDPPNNWAQPPAGNFEGPMVMAQLALGEIKLNVFSTLSQFGSALDVGMEELIIESYFPADEQTRDFFQSLSRLEA